MAKAKFLIRVPTVHDAHGIGEVHVRSWQEAYRGQMPDAFLDSLDVAQRTQMWRRFLTHPGPGTSVFVAEVEGRIAGLVLVGRSRDDPFSQSNQEADPSVGEVFAINLHPDFFRQGIGTALIKTGVEKLREQGFPTITLWVLDGNKRARSFYESLGWADDGTRRTETFGGADLVEGRYRIAFD